MKIDNWLSNSNVQFVLVVLIAIAYVSTPQAVLQNDLDSAVRWASDHLFSLGSKNLLLYPHTNGPLFFLKFPSPFGQSILISVIFDVITKASLGWYILLLVRLFRPQNIWLPFVILIALYTFLTFDFIIISIVLGCSLLSLNTDRFYTLLPGILILTISIFIKASISFPSLFIFGSTLLVLVWRKEYLRSALLAGTFILFFVILTVSLYGFNIDGFVCVIQSFIKTLGYGSDQAIYFNNFPFYILLTALFVLLPALLIRTKRNKEFFLITLLAVFAVWKYSLGREDFTHYRAWYFLCITLATYIVIINGRRGALIGSICYFLSFGFFLTNTKRGDSPKEIKYHTPRFDYLPRVLFRYDKIREEFQNRSNEYLYGAILSKSIINTIGDKTVDVFPWGLAVLSKYNLNYKPRPGFHSTILGRDADQSEGKYFASAHAPNFLLWHNSQPSLYALNAHDQVYLPNPVREAISSIYSNYQFIRQDHDYALWKKVKYQQEYSYNTELDKMIQLGKWFKAPSFDSSQAIYAASNFELPMADKIRSFFYKGRFFKIIYKLKNGKEAAHFIALASLQKGFLLQPYFKNPKMEYEQVDKIFIEPLSKKFNGHQIKLQPSKGFAIRTKVE